MIYSVFVYLIVTVLRYELPWWGGVWSPTAVDIVTSTEVMCLCALICLFVLAGLHKNYLTYFHKILHKRGAYAREETVRFPC